MKRYFLMLLIFYATTTYSQSIVTPSNAQHGVDLGIADDETFSRPNSWSIFQAEPDVKSSSEKIIASDFTGPASRPGISIAWRNAAQVEEVEVRVRNLGDTAANGRVHVDILDERGGLLLSLLPPDEFKEIRIPAYNDGGRDGKIIRMKSSRELNNIIDQFDRSHQRYDVKATVDTVGAQDLNPYDNSKTKSWNVPHRVEPSSATVFNYVFKNVGTDPVNLQWKYEHTVTPKGWEMRGVPKDSKPFLLAAGQEIRGTLTLQSPSNIDEGTFLESRLGLVDVKTGKLWQQREWFLAYDTIPPVVTDYRLVATADHRIAIQALVSDKGSGVLEATGVTTQYSTDGGLTWATKAHNYKAGNFVVPTLFEAVLGPFAPNTPLQVRFMARDTAGNNTMIIPEDATAIKAPPGAEKLLEVARVFPRTQPNGIFYLEPGRSNVGDVAANVAAQLTHNPNQPLNPEAFDKLIREMPVTNAGRQTLRETVAQLRFNPSGNVTAERLSDLVENLPQITEPLPSASSLDMRRVNAEGATTLKMTTFELSVP